MSAEAISVDHGEVQVDAKRNVKSNGIHVNAVASRALFVFHKLQCAFTYKMSDIMDIDKKMFITVSCV